MKLLVCLFFCFPLNCVKQYISVFLSFIPVQQTEDVMLKQLCRFIESSEYYRAFFPLAFIYLSYLKTTAHNYSHLFWHFSLYYAKNWECCHNVLPRQKSHKARGNYPSQSKPKSEQCVPFMLPQYTLQQAYSAFSAIDFHCKWLFSECFQAKCIHH